MHKIDQIFAAYGIWFYGEFIKETVNQKHINNNPYVIYNLIVSQSSLLPSEEPKTQCLVVPIIIRTYIPTNIDIFSQIWLLFINNENKEIILRNEDKIFTEVLWFPKDNVLHTMTINSSKYIAM